jgi:tetratricopeptide (TPR) repeat protein
MAYTGLADSYWISSLWWNLPPHKTYPQAREAVKKAIAIDDTFGEAHASLGIIHMYYDWDLEAAEREFRRALELAPSSSYTRAYYSLYLSLKGRDDEAIAQARRARELDPLSTLTSLILGAAFWSRARRYDEAIEEFKKWVLIEPKDGLAHFHLGIVYQEKLMIKEAISEIEKGVELSGDVPMAVAWASMIHFRFGSRERAQHFLDSLKERARREYIPPTCFVYIHLARGETDEAFEWAKKASEERDGFFIWLRVRPVDSMQLPREPRIDELLDRLGLP